MYVSYVMDKLHDSGLAIRAEVHLIAEVQMLCFFHLASTKLLYQDSTLTGLVLTLLLDIIPQLLYSDSSRLTGI